MGAGEVAEAAEQRAVGEELVTIVDLGGAGEGKLLARQRVDPDADAVPGVAPVAGMALGGPAGGRSRMFPTMGL